ncbi:hypothetical protein HFO91_30770 [Rhizobium leguminosarum]|uniref:hypothetical protein n=1 Tax=Rhizobium leguminosarum TaxID=384 RepID=UPI001C987435|nr:hypothetical protein [Rhizobium leguminosarum]MBY5453964.1 hypothetical protein [Rhizobium leguminosarum]
MPLAMDRLFFTAERERLGFTHEKLAATLGLNLSAPKKWATGARKVPPYMGYVFAALEKGLEPVGTDYPIPIPRLMGYVFAALQAGLEPVGKNHIIEVRSMSGEDSDVA